MPKVLTAELAVELDCDLGEGPYWDDAQQELYFVDITNKQVKIFSPSDSSVKTIKFDQEVSAVFLDQKSELIVAARDGVFTASQDGALKTLLAPIEADDPSIRTNDAKCDSTGRMWVGTMAFDFTPGVAALFTLDSKGLKQVVPVLTIANGLGWSRDQKSMYFIDSPTGRVDIFDCDLQSGELKNRRPLITFDVAAGIPDGLTTDEDGGIWVAFFGGGEVRRYDPSGELTHVVTLPVKQVTSCCFGGKDMTELFITTARYAMNSESLAKEPLAGSLFRLSTTFKGSKSNRYERTGA
ncbi:MAG: SMP-30/gluconolactonase/LRE family protein [Actinobacteria bacterium]|nr:SMP-30/gluconolactonase/LRE family protein [Actinomycetota bacterium]